MTIHLHLADEAATHQLGRKLAALAQPGDVFCLNGTLGMGKSALARAFIRALTQPDEDVPSPTFTLVQVYDTAQWEIWHFDLYRLEKPADALELGIEDAFTQAVSLIEWPDRLGRLIPRDRLEVRILPDTDPQARQVRLTGHGRWQTRLQKDWT